MLQLDVSSHFQMYVALYFGLYDNIDDVLHESEKPLNRFMNF